MQDRLGGGLSRRDGGVPCRSEGGVAGSGRQVFHWLFAANKGNILIAKPKQVMTKQEALIQAAWIVALADDKDEFERILEDVMAM